jgi:diphthamide synthase subunit DPH2
MVKKHKIIALCSSASFYERLLGIASQLEHKGYRVIVPIAARHMKERGDFRVDHYKTWFRNPKDYKKKSTLIIGHFKEIKKSDAILVLNYEKKGTRGYIGGSVLMEMAIAFFLKKQIYILNNVSKKSSFYEEIMAMEPIFLKSQLLCF